MIIIQYFQNTFNEQLTNTLFIAIIFGLVIADLRKYFPIEAFFNLCKIKNPSWKILLFLPYYGLLVTAGLVGVFGVVFFFWLISLIL